MVTVGEPAEIQPNQASEPSAEEALSTTDASAEGSEDKQLSDESTDWQARAEGLQAEKAALEHRLSSSDGQRRRTQDRDEQLNQIGDQVTGLTREMARYFSHMSKDDPELADQIAEARAEGTKDQAERTFSTRYDRVLGDLMGIIRSPDGDGEELLVNEADGARIQTLWSAAGKESQRTGDMSVLYEVNIEAQRMVATEARKKHDAVLRKTREEANARVKREREKAGIYDQDTGPVGASSGEQLSNRERIAREIERRGGSITTN
jgi:hypothetical protein